MTLMELSGSSTFTITTHATKFMNLRISYQTLYRPLNGKNGDMKVDLKELLKKSDQQSEKVTYEEMDTLLKFNQCECWDLENMMTTLKKGEFDS